jgi:uncharacterized membrane-anchored protein YhcB (DUF1043 family)
MRRSRRTNKDSFDLLLDTICNAFGGIVLIAVLITLLTKHARETVDPKSAAEDRDVVEQQIFDTRRELDELRRYFDEIREKAIADPATTAALQAEMDRLEAAKKANNAAWTQWQAAASRAGGNDPDADRLVSERATLARLLADARSAQSAAEATLERMQNRMEELQDKIEQEIAARSEMLRLPKERAKEGGMSNFILFYDEVFPLHLFSNRRWQENRDPLLWVDVTERTCDVTPQRGKGIDPSAVGNQLRETIAEMRKSGEYAAIYLTPESVKAYRALREELVQAGVLFGWTVDERTTQRFGPDGSSPPPL